MSNFQKTDIQTTNYQQNKHFKYFFSWIESQSDERHKHLIISELNSLKTSLSRISQENKPDDYVPFSKHLINAFYQAACDGLNKGYGQEAYHLFFILSNLLPNSYDVHLGLGISCQLLGKHPEALKAFQQAINIHPQSFQPYLFSAESYLEIKDKENFEKNITSALSLIPNDKETFQKHAQYLIHKFSSDQRS